MMEPKRRLFPNSRRVVLFDLEGTLVDFQWNLHCAVNDVRQVLSGLGFDPSPWDDHYAVMRNNAVLRAAHLGLDKREIARRIDAVYDRYDLDAASRWSLMPGVQTLLPYLKEERHVGLGLVTNIGRKGVEQGFAALGMTKFFDVIVTRNDVDLLKPSSEGIYMALGKLGATSADALFVGDSVSDLLAAKDAGVCIAIVQGGESAPPALIALGPDFLWESLEELKNILPGGEHTS